MTSKRPLHPQVQRHLLLAFTSSIARPDQGLTLLECLVAIVVIALMASLITPAVVISVASRVHSQKAEQALEVAQGEIDRVRLLVERGNYTVNDLPSTAAVIEDDAAFSTAATLDANASIYLPSKVPGPQANLLASVPVSEYGAREVDVDGDGTPDLAIQAFRNEGILDGENLPVAFYMGVRVYDVAAFDGTARTLSSTPARLGVIGSDGNRSEQPLAVLYTNIVKSDNEVSYCDYIKFMGSTPSSTFECN